MNDITPQDARDDAGSAPCPCGLPARYRGCCGRWHAGPLHLQAPSAEALMRSRYSAYALGLDDYLLATWHPRTRPAQLQPQPAGLRWLGLQVRRVRTGTGAVTGADAAEAGTHGGGSAPVERAEVEFVARSKLGGRAHRLHETSRFERVDGRWLYLDGDVG